MVDASLISGSVIGSVPQPLGLGIDTLGECPLWWPERSLLCWVDVRGSLVHLFDVVTGQLCDLPTPEKPGGMCRTDGDRLLLAMESGIAYLDPRTGTIAMIASPPHRAEHMRFNEMKADPGGHVWVGYMNDATRTGGGYLYRIGPGGFQVCVDRINVPNSLAWSPDGGTMYFADGVQPIIWAFDFDSHIGIATNRRTFAQVAEGIPDGAAVDAEGGLWSANYGGGKLIRFAADGTETDVVELPFSQPTCPTFGGKDLDILYCTSATQRLSHKELAAQPLAGEMFAFRVPVPGIQPTLAKEALLPEEVHR